MNKHPKAAAAGEVALFGRGHWHHTSRLFGALSLQQQQPPTMAATAHRSLFYHQWAVGSLSNRLLLMCSPPASIQRTHTFSMQVAVASRHLNPNFQWYNDQSNPPSGAVDTSTIHGYRTVYPRRVYPLMASHFLRPLVLYPVTTIDILPIIDIPLLNNAVQFHHLK